MSNRIDRPDGYLENLIPVFEDDYFNESSIFIAILFFQVRGKSKDAETDFDL